VSVRRWQSGVTVLAGLGIVLVLANMVLFERNRSLQGEVNARAQYIQQTVQLEGLHREIVNAIANLAVRNKDDALKTILSQQGITINVGQGQTGTPSSAQGPEGKGRR
jgi:predicted Holliday junction resolvase-like endonuclease